MRDYLERFNISEFIKPSDPRSEILKGPPQILIPPAINPAEDSAVQELTQALDLIPHDEKLTAITWEYFQNKPRSMPNMTVDEYRKNGWKSYDKMKPLKILEGLDLSERLRRYPRVPRQAITVHRFSDKTANGPTQCILRWLELHGHWATRINAMGRQLPTKTIIDVMGHAHVEVGKWIPGSTKKGTADIHSVVNSRHVSIEVKVGCDRMGPEQYKTKEAIELCGGIYYIATDFESFYEWYTKTTNNL